VKNRPRAERFKQVRQAHDSPLRHDKAMNVASVYEREQSDAGGLAGRDKPTFEVMLNRVLQPEAVTRLIECYDVAKYRL
jgi:hypothetical protein